MQRGFILVTVLIFIALITLLTMQVFQTAEIQLRSVETLHAT